MNFQSAFLQKTQETGIIIKKTSTLVNEGKVVWKELSVMSPYISSFSYDRILLLILKCKLILWVSYNFNLGSYFCLMSNAKTYKSWRRKKKLIFYGYLPMYC